eukprot:COSAG06_NODE_1950_length_7997_cov_37.784882_10_plen_184_part_01
MSTFHAKTDQFTKTGSGQTYKHGKNSPKKTGSLTVELEAQLMTGDLKVADVPAAWNAAVKETLGVDVPDDARGYVKTNDKREPLSVLVLVSGCVSSVFVCPEPVLEKQTIVCHFIETINHYRCAHSLTHSLTRSLTHSLTHSHNTLTHMLCYAVLCCAVLCCAVLCCAVLCCAVLCCAVLCCAV